MSHEYALNVKGVNKYFKDQDKTSMLDVFKTNDTSRMFHSVKDMTFAVKPKSIFGVLGPNGCGKSTIIRMITTLMIPDTGTIEIFGVDVEKYPSTVKDFINRVSVDASFFMKLSALENLDYAAGLYGLDRAKAKARSIEILEQLSFPMDKLNTSVEKLSRGQQQKIAITRGFLSKPKLLLLDEPTTGLDPASKLDVQKFVRTVIKEYDITILITSHDMEEIEKLCDGLIIMDSGSIIAEGSVNKLKQEYSEGNLFEIETDDMSLTETVLSGMDGINNVTLVTDDKQNEIIRFRTNNIDDVTYLIMSKLRAFGIGFKSLKCVVPTLEDVFIKLTGKPLEEK